MAQQDFTQDDFEADDFEPEVDPARSIGLGLKRPDTMMYGFDEPYMEKVRVNMANQIAMSNWIPEALKPGMATLSQGIMETPRSIMEFFAAPENVVTPGILRPRARPPEVLPPKPQLLLPPARREPFIAGPGGVQRESLITPHEDARLQGFEPLDPGVPSPTVGERPLDTDFVAEVRRQQGLGYTGHEHMGGTSLELPTTNMPLPAVAGDTRLGFRSSSQADLPYPLNIVPEAVRPRQAQTVTRALHGDVGDFVPDSPPHTFESEVVTPKITEPVRDLRGGTAAIEPGETILPSSPIRVRPPNKSDILSDVPDLEGRTLMTGERVRAFLGVEPREAIARGWVVKDTTEGMTGYRLTQNYETILPSAIKEARTNSGLNIPDDTTVLSQIPEPLQAPVANLIELESRTPSPWKSVYTTLKKLSPVLYQKAARAVHLERQMNAKWIPAYEDAIRKLTRTEKANFGAYVEGALQPPSPAVTDAVKLWQQIESELGDEAMAMGLRMYAGGKPMPFMKNTNNYWPRIPKEPYSEGGLVAKLMDNGMSRSEANTVLRHYQKTGEIKVGAQHARMDRATLPYKFEADAGTQHIRSMTKRMAQHTEFGPLDVKGKGGEGIADLIEATSDPKLTNKLMERLVGRGEKSNARLNRILDVSRRYAAMTKLQNFTIPNMILGSAQTALKASAHPFKATKEVFNLFSKRYRGNLAESGIWQNFTSDIAEEISKFDPYLIGVGETFNRGIAGAVGRSVAREALNDLRKNPTNKRAARELSELVLEPLEELLKQDRLTEDQLAMAAGRAAELSQGLNVAGNLPHWASDPVTGPMSFTGQLILQFKKMGYQATKNVWDSIKSDPVRNIPIWLALSQIAGELTGDTKSFLKGMWKGDPQSEIANRGDWWLEGSGISPAAIQEVSDIAGVPPETIARLMDNWTQAFFLGLPADLIMSSAYGPYGPMAAAAGPVISDISKYITDIGTADYKGIAKQLLRSLTIPGSSGIADAVMEED